MTGETQYWLTREKHRKQWTLWEDFAHVEGLMGRAGGIMVHGSFESIMAAQRAVSPAKVEIGEPDMLDVVETKQAEPISVIFANPASEKTIRLFEGRGFNCGEPGSEVINASAPYTEERHKWLSDFDQKDPEFLEEVRWGSEGE